MTEWVTRRHIWLLSPSDILPPNKHIFHASCRAKKDIFLAYCVPALMTWPPLEDADVWCLAEICECLVSLTPACLVPFHPIAIYNMSLFKFSPPHNIQYVGPALQFTISSCSKCFKTNCPHILQLDTNPTLNWSLPHQYPKLKTGNPWRLCWPGQCHDGISVSASYNCSTCLIADGRLRCVVLFVLVQPLPIYAFA